MTARERIAEDLAKHYPGGKDHDQSKHGKKGKKKWVPPTPEALWETRARQSRRLASQAKKFHGIDITESVEWFLERGVSIGWESGWPDSAAYAVMECQLAAKTLEDKGMGVLPSKIILSAEESYTNEHLGRCYPSGVIEITVGHYAVGKTPDHMFKFGNNSYFDTYIHEIGHVADAWSEKIDGVALHEKFGNFKFSSYGNKVNPKIRQPFGPRAEYAAEAFIATAKNELAFFEGSSHKGLATIIRSEARKIVARQSEEDWKTGVQGPKPVEKRLPGEGIEDNICLYGYSYEAYLKSDEGIKKRFSRAFGNKKARQAQLVARLKRRRGYAKPVPGGTGKQYRSKKRTFSKHADHNQKDHGNWATVNPRTLVDQMERPLVSVAPWLPEAQAQIAGTDQEDWSYADLKGMDEAEYEDWLFRYGELVANIREEGIKEPVWVGPDFVMDGHHRIAAAIEIGIDVPITYEQPEYRSFEKHLAGRHDQMTHGRRKSGGRVEEFIRGVVARDGPRREGTRTYKPHPPVPENSGECYSTSGRFLLDEVRHDQDATLVHGVIRNLTGDVAHGWVELDDGFIFEPATDAVYHPDDFEHLFRPLTIIEYPRITAMSLIAKNKHWGPFDEVSEQWYEAYHGFNQEFGHAYSSHAATEEVIDEFELED